MHLLALLIEVVSIKVAGQQIKKPIDIPRPGKKAKGAAGRQNDTSAPAQQQQQSLTAPPPPPSQGQAPGGSRDAAFKQGIAVLKASKRR